MFGLFVSRCQQCGDILKKTKYKWRINGQTKIVCPACNSTLQRRASAPSFKEGGYIPITSRPPLKGILFVILAIILAIALIGFFLFGKGYLRDSAEKAKSGAQRADGASTEVVDSLSPSESVYPKSLEGFSFPVTLTVDEAIILLDETGKEVTIEAGQKILVTGRSASGTLKMTIDGKFHVGNEARLSQKARIDGK